MGVVALPFALMGFTFGVFAFMQASATAAKVNKLEQQLIQAGVIDSEVEE